MSTAFTNLQAVPIDAALPGQSATTTGKALISNGTNAVWQPITAMIGAGTGQTTAMAAAAAILPTQTGKSGKFLTTDGANNISWADIVFPPNTGVASITISGTKYTGDVTITTVPSATSATNITGIAAIQNGGTGASTAPAALVNLGAAAVNHTHNYAPLVSPAFTGTPTTTTPASNSNDTSIASTAFVQSVVGLAAIGVGQTWQAVTTARVLGTTYTNTTAKPIIVSVTGYGADNTQRCELALAVGTVVVATISTTEIDGTYYGFHNNMTTVVPAGATYKVYSTAGTNTISTWAELR